jgi:hypothetical protein
MPGLQTQGSQEDAALYGLLSLYERIRGAWEERFERSEASGGVSWTRS